MGISEKRRVRFSNWDEEEEQRRSDRGFAFRKKQRKAKTDAKKLKATEARQAWEALTDPLVATAICDWIREAGEYSGLSFLISWIHDRIQRSSLWLRIQPVPTSQGPYTASEMLRNLRNLNCSFEELQNSDRAYQGVLLPVYHHGDFAELFVRSPTVSNESTSGGGDGDEGKDINKDDDHNEKRNFDDNRRQRRRLNK